MCLRGDEGNGEEFGTLDNSDKTIAILGDRWWPQAAKQEVTKNSEYIYMYNAWKQRNERPTVGGVSLRSRNGAPSRKWCVVNGQMTKASNKRVRPPAPSRWGRGGKYSAFDVYRPPCRHNSSSRSLFLPSLERRRSLGSYWEVWE